MAVQWSQLSLEEVLARSEFEDWDTLAKDTLRDPEIWKKFKEFRKTSWRNHLDNQKFVRGMERGKLEKERGRNTLAERQRSRDAIDALAEAKRNFQKVKRECEERIVEAELVVQKALLEKQDACFEIKYGKKRLIEDEDLLKKNLEEIFEEMDRDRKKEKARMFYQLYHEQIEIERSRRVYQIGGLNAH